MESALLLASPSVERAIFPAHNEKYGWPGLLGCIRSNCEKIKTISPAAQKRSILQLSGFTRPTFTRRTNLMALLQPQKQPLSIRRSASGPVAFSL